MEFFAGPEGPAAPGPGSAAAVTARPGRSLEIGRTEGQASAPRTPVASVNAPMARSVNKRRDVLCIA
jgi:hypothetical protein